MVPALHCPCHVQSKIGKQCYGKGSKQKKYGKSKQPPQSPASMEKYILIFFWWVGWQILEFFIAFLDKLDPFTFKK